MLGSLEDVLGGLERLSTEMLRTDGLSLDELVRLIDRRQALVERIAAFQPSDPAVGVRLGKIVRMGAIAAGRLDAARVSLRQELDNMENVRRFAEGLSHTVPDLAPRLNTRG